MVSRFSVHGYLYFVSRLVFSIGVFTGTSTVTGNGVRTGIYIDIGIDVG